MNSVEKINDIHVLRHRFYSLRVSILTELFNFEVAIYRESLLN